MGRTQIMTYDIRAKLRKFYQTPLPRWGNFEAVYIQSWYQNAAKILGMQMLCGGNNISEEIFSEIVCSRG